MMRHRPRKRFGQHFLHDPAVLERIVEAIAPAAGELLVEIGPGEGALTRRLAARGARLVAIEIDRDLAARLAREFAPAQLELHCADALEFDLARLPAGARLVGNLPYNISTAFLFRVAAQGERVRDCHFMLQREVVERMVAEPGTPSYGRLSVALQVRFAMTRLFTVGRGAFRPPPAVESAFVRLVPLGAPAPPAAFAPLLRRAFSARRKTLRNALGLPATELAALGFDPAARPEDLSPADYLRLAATFAR
ncbi:MAG: 16S rRNA (adenine(1518)-N(6)/adenine(1519)-N(6))-dimethyltransferase RsmA [Burkholderiales bacterium]|nr:16S rRNA (adenine(1518)-N(6)/adenine(1519)-N(6))-dimethyltransferase RsmA [Burkholderiales bacterium]